MRRTAPLILALVATNVLADGVKSLEFSRAAEGISAVVVKAGVGEVEVLADKGSTIAAHVEVTSKHGGFWGSHRPLPDRLEITGTVRDGTLTLTLLPEHHDERAFSENWSVRLPAGLAARVKMGVGDVRVLDTTGDVEVQVGVGDIRVEGADASYGDIEAHAGVGDATVRTPGSREEGDGFIGHRVHTHGSGKAQIRVSVGVGDVSVRLR
jgi:hypothetical protein